MLRYDLDKLGWHAFEGLIAALLKAQLGLGIEIWGGNSDIGRDAYFVGSLAYPAASPPGHDTAYLFQCKFVEGASAAGAKPYDLLLKAVSTECQAIKKRLATRPTREPIWPMAPNIYALMTNAPLTPRTRRKLQELIQGTLPESAIYLHSGSDVCAWLDSTPRIATAFPQILGLNDLTTFLRNSVNHETITRSAAVLEHAKSLARVFVPTTAYYEAFAKLAQHSFVVLEGPPEMGKTAIGRTIGLAKLSEGWEYLECAKASGAVPGFEC